MVIQFFMVLNNFKALFLLIVLIFIVIRSCSCTNSSLSCRQEERNALIRFAKTVDPIFINGSKASEQECCDWNWITCDGVTGHVVKLELYLLDEIQVPPFPFGFFTAIKLDDDSLAQLKFLNHLNLRGLVLDRCSRIPEFIGSMKHLKFLDLSGVGFCGRVPPHLGNLTNLEFLSLDSEYGLGQLSLDEPQWISRLVALKHLDLSHVSVEEGARNDLMTVLSALPSLSYLHLHHCGLGSFHLLDDIVLNSTFYFSGLQYLDLSGNYLQGKIPSAIQNMTSLTYLDMSNNHFNSSVPSWFGRFANLQHLYLSRNNFDNGLASLPVNLKELDLSLNQLSETIPSSLGKFLVLSMLNLSCNQLIGDIPRSLGRLQSLKKLDLRNNHLNGAIKVIGQLSSLEYLDLSQNNLSAPIPSDIGRNMSQLRSLFLYNNLITGPIPTSLCDMFLLEDVDLADNILIGSIPHCSRRISSSALRRLDLRNNHLSGTVFNNIRELPSTLEYLDLSNNRISGDIPSDIGRKLLPKLRYLLLNDNLISGQIPPSLCDMFHLEVLNLANNTLTRNIPDCWCESSPLVAINLSFNNLTGVIPSSIMNLFKLQSVHLNKNNLHGELPKALGYLGGLVILDLGENNLYGDVPSWIGESFLSNLQILRLRDNNLYGTIPYQLCWLFGLQILDLAGNDLEGEIPACFNFIYGMSNNPSPDGLSPATVSIVAPSADWSKEKMTEVLKGREMEYTKNLQYVVTFDLSRNKLIGSIPEELTLLTKLDCLNLSYNVLSGHIPDKIGSLKLLESLDLSNNQLSGTIPPSISDLSMLSHFNLANNNLNGRIPKGNQLDTVYDSDNSIYDGNPLLCGEPLPKLCPGDKLPSLLPYVPSKHDEDDDQDVLEMPMFYVVVMLGFGTGFWGVIGGLMLNKSWRAAYFKFFEEVIDKIYVFVKVKLAMLKRSRISREHA